MNTTMRENKNAFATIANSGIATIERPSTMAIAAPKAAPDATPKVNGETNGFPKQPCIIAPAMARDAPPTIAIKIRGKRNCHSMFDCNSVESSRPMRIFRDVIKSRFVEEPKPIATMASTKVAKLSPIKTSICCNLR